MSSSRTVTDPRKNVVPANEVVELDLQSCADDLHKSAEIYFSLAGWNEEDDGNVAILATFAEELVSTAVWTLYAKLFRFGPFRVRGIGLYHACHSATWSMRLLPARSH